MANISWLNDSCAPIKHCYALNDSHDRKMVRPGSMSATANWSDVVSQYSEKPSVISNSFTFPLSPQISRVRAELKFKGSLTSVQRQNFLVSMPTEVNYHQQLDRDNQFRQSRYSPKKIQQKSEKNMIMDSLVDCATLIVETIWPLSATPIRIGTRKVLPLRSFIQETLHWSKTNYSTLQVALYYLILIKPHVLNQKYTINKFTRTNFKYTLLCGRRMLLSAIILASKYLQDQNYSTETWSVISGLDISEINKNEIAFLLAINWKLHVTETIYQRWTGIFLKNILKPNISATEMDIARIKNSHIWKLMILELSPQLDNLNLSMSEAINSQPIPCHIPEVMEPSIISHDMTEMSLTLLNCTANFLKPLNSPKNSKKDFLSVLNCPSQPQENLQSSIRNIPLVKSTFDGPERLPIENFQNLQTLRVSPKRCGNQIPISPKYLPKPLDLLSDSTRPLPTCLKISERVSSDVFRSNSSSLSSLILSSNGETSIRRSPQLCLGRDLNYKKEQTITLNKIRKDHSDSCIDKIPDSYLSFYWKDCMEPCPEKYLRQDKAHQNHIVRGREATVTLQRLDQHGDSLGDSVVTNSKGILRTDHDSKLVEIPDLLYDSHLLSTSKKLSHTDLNLINFPWDISRNKRSKCDSDFLVPRKRICCAIELSKALFSECLHPPVSKLNPPSN